MWKSWLLYSAGVVLLVVLAFVFYPYLSAWYQEKLITQLAIIEEVGLLGIMAVMIGFIGVSMGIFNKSRISDLTPVFILIGIFLFVLFLNKLDQNADGFLSNISLTVAGLLSYGLCFFPARFITRARNSRKNMAVAT
jgi:hypothetical protein